MAGRVCVILGAGKGLGHSLARKFANDGYRVVVSRRSAMSAEDTASCNAVSAVQCDVTKEEDVNNLFKQVEQELGPVHTVLYNAGRGVWKTWLEASLEEFDQAYECNAKGLLMVAKAVGPGMIERGEGCIGVTGATASLRGKPFTSVFAPSKGAQRMLAQALARDLGPKGIHVFLAIIDGQMVPGKMDSDDVATSYLALANQPKSAWTFELDLRNFDENW